jgi:hypothetical protein
MRYFVIANNLGSVVVNDEESEVSEQPYLQLRGPIIYLKSSDCMIYLPTCVYDFSPVLQLMLPS